MLLCICFFICAAACVPVYAAPVYAYGQTYSDSVPAEGLTYARANVRDAYFFKSTNLTSSVFAVPYTYCVQVISEEGDWYYAAYASDYGAYKQQTGYVRKSDFTLLDGVPRVTYLYKTVPITFTIDTGEATLPTLNMTVEAAYYGTYYSGATVYSYVCYQNSFGYIKGAYDDYPLNLDDETQDNVPTSGDGVTQTNGGQAKLSVGLIVLIVLVALFAVVMVILYFATRRTKVD